MKKLEPGMLCRVVNFGHGADGMIVTVIRYSKSSDNVGGVEFTSDAVLTTGQIPYEDCDVPADGWIRDCCLEPINPDHRPADEEWQAYFNRMLCGGQKAKEKPLDRSGARG